jgi:SAM-dependent methyltransferase
MAYRWNTSDFAIGYDCAAATIHPYYTTIQDEILRLLESHLANSGIVIDLGGGSGRLMERILDRWPQAHGIIIDQSQPFLALAERRLNRFGHRATCVFAHLQDDWCSALCTPNSALTVTTFVSMSAIHHLDPAEKQSLYLRCYDLLAPGGVLLNGDEVRDADDHEYLATLNSWADHMRRQMAAGSIPPLFHTALHGWIDRNVTRFGQPKQSGDDCHETIDAQLTYICSAGFTIADVPWQKGLWAIFRGVK